MAIIQSFDLNMIPESEPVVVHVNQYDEGTGRLVASLWNGDTSYTPAVGATATIQGSKPSGKGFDYPATISGSTVTADLTEQMAIEYGIVRCQIVIKEGDNITGTFVFNLDVQKSALPADADMSASEYQIVMELIETAEMINLNPPIIGDNGHWWVWNTPTQAYVDSGVDASISVEISDITMLEPTATPYVTNTGTDTDPVFHLFIPRGKGISQIAKTGTSGLVDTYTITYSDNTTTTFTVTNGKSAYQCAVDGGYSGTEAQFNTDLGNFQSYATSAENSKEDSEAWAVGKRNGTDVPSTDPAYHNNAKWYAEHVGGGHTIVNGAGTSMPQRGKLQFMGMTVTDDSANDKTVVTGASGLLPYLYIDSEAGATVTVVAPDSSVITPTAAGSGHWECELPGYGIYVIHSVLGGSDATVSVTIDTVKEYHITDNHYDFTINVTAQVGATIRVECGTEVYTDTGTGSPVAFVVHQSSATYTLTATLDGYTDTQTVTSAATTGQSISVTLHIFTATLAISTTSSEFAGATITITKGGTTVGTATFPASSPYSVNYTVHETGSYSVSVTYHNRTYTDTHTVSAEGTTSFTLIVNIEVTVTLYGAAEDTITYTDADGQHVVTFAAGQTSASGVAISVLPSSATVTFTSSIADDPSNISNRYSKSVTITSGTTNIYVMPDHVLYWYGYEPVTFAGHANYTGLTAHAPDVTHNLRTIDGVLNWSGHTYIRGTVDTNTKYDLSTASHIKMISNSVSATGTKDGDKSSVSLNMASSIAANGQYTALSPTKIIVSGGSISSKTLIDYDISAISKTEVYILIALQQITGSTSLNFSALIYE